MAGNMNRGSGGLVHHWKHGWIPLTHAAALSKAGGSQIGAARIMQRHGIADGPKSLHSVDRSNGGKGKPDAPKAVSKDHNLAALEVRKGSNDKGFVVTHKPSGLHLGHTFATKGAAEAARQEHASTPHDLNVPADKLHADATKHLGDVTAKHRQTEYQRGQQASQVVAAKRNRPAGPKVSNPAKAGDLVVVSSEHSDWSGKGRTVTEQHTPGVVTHVHSDGTPIAYKDAQGRFATVGPRDKTRVMSQDEIDVQGLLGQVKSTNKWSGGQDKAHFDNLDAIQSAAKSFRKSKSDGLPAGFKSSGFADDFKDVKVRPGVRGGGSGLPESTASVPSVKTPHAAPHTLKPGDKATVKGIDENGSPIEFTGEVRGRTAVTVGKGTKKTPMLGITVRRESPTTGGLRNDTVYVPDPDRDPSKIDAARKAGGERDQLRRDLNAKYSGKGSSYMQQRHGVDPSVMSDADLAKYHKSLQAEHDMVLLSDGKKLRDATAAEVAKRNAAPTPAGSVHATRATQLREAAAKKRADADRIANGAGVNDRAAAMLSGKTHARQVARDDSSLRRFAETRRQADALEAQARTAEGRVAREQEKQRAANLDLKPSDVTPGDMVLHNGRLQIVTKVNKTTVNVPSGYSWDDKVPLSKVTRHVPLSTQSDSAIRKAFDATKDPKVRSALKAELLRRGLSAD